MIMVQESGSGKKRMELDKHYIEDSNKELVLDRYKKLEKTVNQLSFSPRDIHASGPLEPWPHVRLQNRNNTTNDQGLHCTLPFIWRVNLSMIDDGNQST